MPEQIVGDYIIKTDFIHNRKVGSGSHFAYVQHQVGRRVYIVPCMGGLEIEEACSMLAERVERDYPGEGEKAYESARDQITSKDFDLEWSEIQHRIKLFKKGGGQVPSVLVVPDELDPTQWNTIVPDNDGNPWVYKTPKGIIDEILPPPSRETTYKRHGGYYNRPTERRRK